MSVYNNTQIKQAVTDGLIAFSPMPPKDGHHISISLTLGSYYYRTESEKVHAIYNPYDKESVEHYFDGPQKALPYREWCTLNGVKAHDKILPDQLVISLRPHERILAHTHEFFGILPPIIGEVKPCSDWERNGITVRCGSGWVNPGDSGRLTLEIRNFNNRESVLLPVGERIVQLVFHETGKTSSHVGTEQEGTPDKKSHQAIDLDGLIETWSPDMLLPRTYEEELSLPPKIEGLAYH